MIDKIFKVGVLLVAVGFLFAYVYNRKPSAPPNNSTCTRYTVVAGNNSDIYTIYIVDTQEGMVYYGRADGTLRDHPLLWRISNPKEEAKK